jgi:hypothetical protein
VAAVQRQRERRHQKSLVKGARNGQLLPGEKKKLRKEKIAAKRATRAAERGLSALSLLSEIDKFGASGQDMMVLPPCGKHKQVSRVWSGHARLACLCALPVSSVLPQEASAADCYSCTL